MFFVYFAKSLKNGKIYVGKTTKDPHIRLKEHNTGTNAWTKKNVPFELVYYESFVCAEDMTKREAFYKTGMGKRIKYAIAKEMGS
jgi:predicted GIY-YIG superfamily endonuclease